MKADTRCCNIRQWLHHCLGPICDSAKKSVLPARSCTSQSHSWCPHRDGTFPVSRSLVGSPAWMLAQTRWRFKVKEKSRDVQNDKCKIFLKSKLKARSVFSLTHSNLSTCALHQFTNWVLQGKKTEMDESSLWDHPRCISYFTINIIFFQGCKRQKPLEWRWENWWCVMHKVYW